MSQHKIKSMIGMQPITAAGHCLFGDSKKVRSACQVVEKVAPHRGPVLLRGESGTGKEVVARAIHWRSPRAQQAFVAVNAGAIPQELFESALFGHRKGSFTGAMADHEGYFDQAHGGTLFLDEIGDLPLLQQVKLLRVLQTGEIQPVGARDVHFVDVRVVAATNRPLERLVEAGRFREDLYFRLNLFTITLPPLRERVEDLAPLAEAFLRRMAVEVRRDELRWSPAALRILQKYPWPGNIRELENVVQFAVAMAEGTIIHVEALPERIRRGEVPFDLSRRYAQADMPRHAGLVGDNAPPTPRIQDQGEETPPKTSIFSENSLTHSPTHSPDSEGVTHSRLLKDVIRDHILTVYAECKNNKTHTARALGISLRGVQLHLRRYLSESAPLRRPRRTNRTQRAANK
ncbi:MAG: sigma-54 dependent transcriptional regulator [Candidatus Ozemobacteraceae bacterium]